MSADNWYVIRNHPAGGYTPVMGFGEEDIRDVSVRDDFKFNTVKEALLWADAQYSEYGVSVHPECDGPMLGQIEEFIADFLDIHSVVAKELVAGLNSAGLI